MTQTTLEEQAQVDAAEPRVVETGAAIDETSISPGAIKASDTRLHFVDCFPRAGVVHVALTLCACTLFLGTSWSRLSYEWTWPALSQGRGLLEAFAAGQAPVELGWLGSVAWFALHAVGGLELLSALHAGCVAVTGLLLYVSLGTRVASPIWKLSLVAVWWLASLATLRAVGPAIIFPPLLTAAALVLAGYSSRRVLLVGIPLLVAAGFGFWPPAILTLGEQGVYIPFHIASWTGVAIALMLLATAVVLRLSPRRWTVGDAVLLTGATGAMLTNMALAPCAAMVWAWLLAPHFEAVFPPRDTSLLASRGTRLRAVICSLAVVVALVWGPHTGRWLKRQSLPDAALAYPAAPVYLADVAASAQCAGRLFAPPVWGDYLELTTRGALAPAWKPLLRRDRAEYTDYDAIYDGTLRWLDVADHHDVRFLALSRRENRVLSLEVQQHPRCRVLFQDQSSLLVELLPAS